MIAYPGSQTDKSKYRSVEVRHRDHVELTEDEEQHEATITARGQVRLEPVHR